MKAKDLIHVEFFKKVKTGEELSIFFKNLQKHGLEMPEGELDEHLAYCKFDKR